MALNDDQKALCAAWVSSPNRKWQTLNRSQWKYQFREKTLVRYVEEASMDESIVPLLLEYLTSDDCKTTLQLYGQGVDPSWTPTRAWYEISNKAVGNVRAVRLYHGIAIEPTDGEDGPYLVEDGCAYKVSWTYYWKRTSVPSAPASTSGVSYRIVNVQRDPDTGLFNYAVEKRERVQQDIALYLMRTTQYEDVSEEVHLGVRGDESAGGRAASASNGTVTTRKVTKNGDCTHDVHNTVTTDKAVPSASVTTAAGVRGTTVTTTNRNMPQAASAEGLAPGESVQNQRTDSGLWNQTIRRIVRDAVAWIRGTCRKDLFSHSHSETTNQREDPGFEHVEEATGGVIAEKHVQRTEDGYDVTEHVTTERQVAGASETVSVGLNGKTVVTVNRNMPEKAETSGLGIGESVQNQRTPGGLWNQTIHRRDEQAEVQNSKSCAKTIFEHRQGDVRTRGANPGFSHVADAGGGKTRSESVTRTETGAYRVDARETQELPVSDAVVSYRKTLTGLVTQRTHRNQSAPLGAPDEVGESVTNRRTDGGLWDVTETAEGRSPAGKTGEGCSRDFFTHQHSTTKNELEMQDPETDFATGKIVRKSASKNPNGSANNTTTETTAKPQTNEYQYTRGDGAVVHVKQWWNQEQRPDAPAAEGAEVASYTDRYNSFGLHDGATTWLTNVPKKITSELSFIKHGKTIVFYEVAYSRQRRRVRHRTWEVQVHFKCNDAYTDYVSDKLNADINRTNSGIMCVRLIRGPYADRAGNLKADWEWVYLLTPPDEGGGGWVDCKIGCKHAKAYTDAGDLRNAVRELLGGGDAGAAAERQQGNIAGALAELPIAIAAANNFMSVDQMRAEFARLEEGRREARK